MTAAGGEVRANPRAWEVCLPLFTRSPPVSEVVRYNILSILSDSIGLLKHDGQSLELIKAALMSAQAKQQQAGTDGFLRMFMMPGLSHCQGGPGAGNIGGATPAMSHDPKHDVVAALDAWVVRHQAPDRLIARKKLSPASRKQGGVFYSRSSIFSFGLPPTSWANAAAMKGSRSPSRTSCGRT